MSDPAASSDGGSGTVYLVGSGPGDPGLLTVRAAELIASADAVLYDALTHPAVLERIAPGAEVRPLRAEASPDDVTRELVALARRHSRVVRLTGGDPFLFGPAGREALALQAAGVAFEVVPGMAAAVAAPAYAGIPLTLPGAAHSVTFRASGAGLDGGAGTGEAGRNAETRVVALAEPRAEPAIDRLLAEGLLPETPAALIERATHPRQATRVGTLESLRRDGASDLRLPALLVVGEVVRLRERLRWYEARPLFGMRIVITRARAQSSEFVRSLERLGAEVIAFPTIRITDPSDPRPLRAAVREADRFDWIVFTSVNGVERFWAELRAAGRDTRLLAGVSLCAIGPATAAALEMEGASADLVPPEFVAESVVDALSAEGGVHGARILLPRAEVARTVLPESLRERGAEVVEVAAYRTVPDAEQAAEVRQRLDAGEVDLITFTASSTVRNFVDVVGASIGSARVACIGPITAETARAAGLPVHVQAQSFTIPGLVEAIRTDAAGKGTPW